MNCTHLTAMPVGQGVLTPHGHYGVVVETRDDVVAVYRPDLAFRVRYDCDELILASATRESR